MESIVLKNRQLPLTPSSCRGSFMFELMIGIMILSAVFATIAVLQTRNTQERFDVSEAETMVNAKSIFTQYVRANREGILEALVDNDAAAIGEHCRVRGALAHSNARNTCAFDLELLQSGGFFPGSVNVERIQSDDEGGDYRYVGIVRLTNPGPGCTGPTTCGMEMIVVQSAEGTMNISADQAQRMNERAIRKAQVLGASGGVIPYGDVGFCQAGASGVEACGHGWQVDMADFLDPSEVNRIKSLIRTDQRPGQ